MLEKGQISPYQFLLLVLLFTIGPAVLFESSMISLFAKQDAWISAAIGVGAGMTLIWLYTIIGDRYPEKTLFDYNELVFGKGLGKVISVLFFFFIFMIASHNLRNIGNFVNVQIMPDTPVHFIMILFLIVVVYATRLGLEPLARTAEIMVPWVILFLFILLAALPPNFETENLKPIMERGPKPIIKGSLSVIAFPYLESVLLLMLYPYVKNKKGAKKAFLVGAVIGGFVLIIITLYSILVLGADFTARNLYPAYTLAKQINLANIFQRLEAIVAGMWFISIFFKLTICFYASSLGLAQILQLKDYRPLTLPLGMILVCLATFVTPNMVEFQSYLMKYEFPYNLTFGLFLPLLILSISMFRRRGAG